MTTRSGPTVPEGQYPPFAALTPDNHAAWVLISTAFGLASFLVFGGIRILVRSIIRHGFGTDDYLLCAATVLAVIQSSLILRACSKGLGMAIDRVSPEAQQDVQKIYYTSNLFFVVVIGLSKISVVCFLHRISRLKQHKVVFNLGMGLIAAWMVGSLLVLAIQCNPGQPWISIGEECRGIVSSFLGINENSKY